MQYQSNAERGRRAKIITISLIAAAVVLLIGAWVIIAAVRSIRNRNAAVENSNQTAATAQVDGTAKTNVKTDGTIVTTDGKSGTTTTETDNTVTVISPAEQYDANANANVQVGATVCVNGDIPSTGPADNAIVAVLIGVAVYLFSKNVMLVQSQSKRTA